MSDIKDLERALTYSKTQPDDIAVFILRGAIERYTASQKVYPVSSEKPVLPDILKQIGQSQKLGCPYCGLHGAHYCVGRKPGTGTGIEYWYNQPTAMINLGGSIGTGGSTHERRVGGQGIAQGSGQGGTR